MTVVLPTAIGGIVSGACSPSPGPPARRHRCCSPSSPYPVNKNVFSGPTTALPAQIFANATSPYDGAQARAWGAALTLIVIAFILMVGARIITARFTRWGARKP